MVNLNDQSYSITPELLYTGITNLELRLRFGWIRGAGRRNSGKNPTTTASNSGRGITFRRLVMNRQQVAISARI